MLAVLGAASSSLLMGHMPYRQWQVFRAVHLFVVTSSTDPQAGELADRIAETLAARLPKSKALAAEARDAHEVMQLLRSHQIQVALVTTDEADAAQRGAGDIAEGGAIALRVLTQLGSRLLVVLPDFPDDKAYDIARALADFPAAQRTADPAAPAVPLHPGAIAFREGRPPPPAR
ncbi:MAG TPA: hypothetical protein VMT29_17800 [Steroidobacteraceae bacterium]|nr:hypothetical protein [Steroidobacteraceae bacterium]